MRKKLRLDDLTPRQLLMGAAGLFVLSVVVTLIVLAASPRRRQPAPASGPSPQPAPLGIQDFLLEAPQAPAGPGVALYRERLPRWSEEQVERYWIPVEKAILGILRRENDRRAEELLREVP